MFKWLKKLGEGINKSLEKMAESNKQLYGNKRLDCCDLKDKK